MAVGAIKAPNIGVPIIDLKISNNPVLPACEGQALLDRLTAAGLKPGAAELARNLGTCP